MMYYKYEIQAEEEEESENENEKAKRNENITHTSRAWIKVVRFAERTFTLENA